MMGLSSEDIKAAVRDAFRDAHYLPTAGRKPAVASMAPSARPDRSYSVSGEQPKGVGQKLTPPVPATDLRAVAIHEAAHAAVGVVLGGAFARVELSADGGGRCTFADLNPGADARQHLIAAAGPIAQAVYVHGPHPSSGQIDGLLGAGRGSDREVLHRKALETGDVLVPTTKVLPLVLRLWPAICVLAVDLDDGKWLGHKHVTAALGLSNNSQLHSFELANLVAGLRQVPDPTVPR